MSRDLQHHTHGAPPAAAATARDPVCGMTVTVAGARHTHRHAGHLHYFCNPRCRDKFIADPARYLDADIKAKAEQAEARSMPGGVDLHLPHASRDRAGGPG